MTPNALLVSTLVLASVLFPSLAQAERWRIPLNEAPAVLATDASFSRMTQGWTFRLDCPDTARSLEKINIRLENGASLREVFRAFVIDAIYFGVKRVETINPTFAHQLIANASRSPITFACKDEIHGTSLHKTAGLYEAFRVSRLFGPKKIKHAISIHGHVILGYLISLDYEKSVAEDARAALPAFRDSLLGEAANFAYAARTQRGTPFHEFLHFSGAGNLESEIHNGLEEDEYDRDVIYSCEHFAFYKPTINSCRTCALARFEGQDRSLLSNRQEDVLRADNACLRALSTRVFPD